MKGTKKNLTIALAGLLLAVSGQSQADYEYINNADYEYFNNGNGMFPTSWCINKGFVKADLLYLTAHEDGLSNPWEPTVVFEDSSSGSSDSFTLAIGKGKSPHYKWDLGYRIGAGIDFQNCKWDIAAFWTHFSPSRSKHSQNRPSWKLDYDTVDVVVGYKCQFNECFTLDAFGGVRVARIHQHIHGRVVNRFIHESEEDSDSISFLSRKNKQEFDGVGFLFGLAGEFDLGCGFKAYLEGDTGTICGHNKMKSFVALARDDSDFAAFAFKHRQKACPYYVESAVGIQWETCLCNGISLVLDLGYESHNYLNFGRIFERGNLYIHGGKFGAALKF